MPVRQATLTALSGRKEDRAAEEPKKLKQKGSSGRGKPTSALGTPRLGESDLPGLVQALLDLTEPEPATAPNLDPGGTHTLAAPLTKTSILLPVSAISPLPSATLISSPLTEDAEGEAAVAVPAVANNAAPEGGPTIRPNGKGARTTAEGEIDYHHDSEAEFGHLLDYYCIEWQYEPHQFPLEWRDSRPIVMFTPDFYLPEYDLYIELTTMRQSLVRRKNRKLRLLRALYPEINIKLLYRRDYHRLLQRFGIAPEELDAEAAQSAELAAQAEPQSTAEGACE